MKKYFLIVMAIALGSFTATFAEEKNEEVSNSKSVEFLKKDGTLIIKDFFPETNVKGATCQVLMLTDVVSGQKTGCFRIETKYVSQYTSDSYIGTLDYEELGACIQSLRYLQENVLNTVPEHYTECVYKTLDGVQIGCFWSSRKSTWSSYIQTKSYSSRSIVYLDSSSIQQIIQLMEQAQVTIAENLK